MITPYSNTISVTTLGALLLDTYTGSANQKVTIGKKINAIYKGDNYANPIEIEGEFYILKHVDYDSEMKLVNELPPQNLEIDE